MLCLAIESTAHTFASAVISSKGEIISDVRSMYQSDTHGIIPSEAAQHHEKLYHQIIKKAIEESKIEKFDLLAYSRGPGLSPCLKVGLKAAKEYSEELKIPLIGVNHCLAHLSSAHLFTEVKDPVYVFVSGANTQIIALEGGKFRIFGETLDTGLGNALDKFGREINLGFPAGPKIEQLAKNGSYIELPYIVKGMDLSFSGIVTSAISKFKKGIKKEDLCFSIQETMFSMLTEVTERALAHTGKKEAVIIGGVAANKRLAEMLSIMCKERNAKLFTVPLKYSGDNGANIGYQGLIEYINGRREKELDIFPYERIDHVNVFWNPSDDISKLPH